MEKKQVSPGNKARFTGSLSSDLNITEIVQLVGRNVKRGLLTIFGKQGNAKIYLDNGNIVHASYRNIKGIQALAELIPWKNEHFIFEEEVVTNEINIGCDCNSALLDAVKRFDERNNSTDAHLSLVAEEEASMATLKEQLQDFLNVDGVSTVVVVGRDGFIIDSASMGAFPIDEVGAVVSTGLGSSESMGSDLKVGEMQQGMLEYENGIIFMRGLGEDAIFVLVAHPDANLGMVRLQIKRRIDDIRVSLE